MIEIYCDGSAVPNPGQLYYGVVIIQNGEFLEKDVDKIGEGTNNQAEYMSLQRALDFIEMFSKDSPKEIFRIFMDSMLVLKQVAKQWQCKNENLRALRDNILDRLRELPAVEFRYVASEGNLAHEAIEKAYPEAATFSFKSGGK